MGETNFPTLLPSRWWRKSLSIMVQSVGTTMLVVLIKESLQKSQNPTTMVLEYGESRGTARIASFTKGRWRLMKRSKVMLLQAKGNSTQLDLNFVLDLNQNDSYVDVVLDVTSWWIDSGALRHIWKLRNWFKTFNKVVDGKSLYKATIFLLRFLEKDR